MWRLIKYIGKVTLILKNSIFRGEKNTSSNNQGYPNFDDTINAYQQPEQWSPHNQMNQQ